MTALSFTVAGIPAAQGSKRAVRNQHTGRIQLIESSKRLPTWRDDVRAAAEKALIEYADRAADDGNADEGVLWNSPLQVTIWFRLPRPKGHYRTGRNAGMLRDAAPTYPAGKPDLDKLQRAVLDALTGVVWGDDSQVVHVKAWKTYGPRPGAGITVEVAP